MAMLLAVRFFLAQRRQVGFKTRQPGIQRVGKAALFFKDDF